MDISSIRARLPQMPNINLPTMLTLLRILIIPVVTVVYYFPFSWAHPLAAIFFMIACITDWLDGFLARTMSQMTPLGAFLDPVADKLLIAVILVLILGYHEISYLSLPAAVIIGREIAISALREWMAELGKRASVAVVFVSKIKTAIQMIALTVLLWYHPGSAVWLKWLGSFLLYVAAALTLWSMTIYLKLAWPDLTSAAEK